MNEVAVKKYSLAFLALMVCGFSVVGRSLGDTLWYEGETHLKNIRQLTFGGDNAEAYWSFDDQQLIFQSNWDSLTSQGCDQIFTMNANANAKHRNYRLVSTGDGRTTCSYFMPNGQILFASTHGHGALCPETQMKHGGKYVWDIFPTYDIFIANPDGSGRKTLIASEFYDAEATVSPDGKYIVFTSTRSGDLELWRYETATGALKQLTHELGYDGGAFFSPDSKMIVWRASRPTGDNAETYKKLLKDNIVEPSSMNLYISDINGNNIRQVTNLDGANWAPFFHPSGKKIIFSSNHHSMNRGGRLFALFMVDLDGKNLKQITYSNTFEAFPMFSNDGKKLVFASNRNMEKKPSRSTNIFIAEWVE